MVRNFLGCVFPSVPVAVSSLLRGSAIVVGDHAYRTLHHTHLQQVGAATGRLTSGMSAPPSLSGVSATKTSAASIPAGNLLHYRVVDVSIAAWSALRWRILSDRFAMTSGVTSKP